MSISERQAPDFSHAFRGYDRAQVDEYLTSYTEYSVQVEERARKAGTRLVQCRRELASAPGTVGISERLASILQLANEEAEEIRARPGPRARPRLWPPRATPSAPSTTPPPPGRHPAGDRRALRRPRRSCSSGSSRSAAGSSRRPSVTRGTHPGWRRVRAEVKLFDAEAVDDDPAAATPGGVAAVADAEPVVDPDAVTQRITTTGPPPEHEEVVE